MDKIRLQKLLIDYSTNEIQAEDYNELMDLISKSKHDGELYTFMEKVWNSSPMEKSFSDLQSDMLFQRIIGDSRFSGTIKNNSRSVKLWTGIAAAAVILITLSVALFYTNKNTFISSGKSDFSKYDQKPGGNHAVLTLADGSEIELTDATVGKIAEQAGLSIQQTADGQIVYEVASTAKSTGENGVEAGSNMVSTPKGGQYQVNLPDGTKVWLNASSSLKFPTAFTDNNKRIVTLTGEGYFEVAKSTMPFIVKTKDQEVEVLGTHFNISSYTNDIETKTTLLEGKVKVEQLNDVSAVHTADGIVLKPGQQASLKAGQLNVKSVDVAAEIAWKNGYFIFKDEDVRSIMRKIERWYNVEVVYAKDFQNRSFEGSISRFKNVSEVLRKFELTGNIHFKMEERRITVMP